MKQSVLRKRRKLTSCSNEVDEPRDCSRGIARHLEEREEWKAHDDAEAPNRDAAFGAVPQKLRCPALQCKAVQIPHGTIRISVSGGEDAGHHETVGIVNIDGHTDDVNGQYAENLRIDNVREYLDFEVNHSNNVGRGRSSTRSPAARHRAR